ncbi:MAG: peptidoglycan editing factor PgeF [Oscillospiraceae bacterium]|nr:peptidoglycan editing factor PgeF [Oscillospiraceae bacterium]
MFIENNENGLVYMSSSLIGTRHAFTTRFGGVSGGIFASLNLGSNRGDDPAAVRENYRRVCALMGAGIDEAAVTKQVHGSVVRTVTEKDRHVCMSAVPYEADGLVTAVRGLPLMCFTADCVPALLCESDAGVIAAVHCGWRSSVGDILKNAVEALCDLGAQKEKICCALGPAIGRCCFETDDDVPDAVSAYLGGDTEGLFVRRADGKTLVDLRGANRRRLIQLGLRGENIDVSDECTVCRHDKYWSHRYTRGQRGSQAAVIVLEVEK